MANLFTFSLEGLARAVAGRASLDDTRLLFGAWPQLFPQLAPQEQQLDGNEFAVYLTAVARDSRAANGPNWRRPNALAAVRSSFLAATTPMAAVAMGRRVLGGPVTTSAGRRSGRAPRPKPRTRAKPKRTR